MRLPQHVRRKIADASQSCMHRRSRQKVCHFARVERLETRCLLTGDIDPAFFQQVISAGNGTAICDCSAYPSDRTAIFILDPVSPVGAPAQPAALEPTTITPWMWSVFDPWMKMEMDPELRRKIEIEVRKQVDLAIQRTMDLTTDRPPGPAGLGTATQAFLDWKLADFRRDVLPYLEGPRLSSWGYRVPSYMKDEDFVLRFGGGNVQRYGNGYLIAMQLSFSSSNLVKMHPDGTLDETFGNKGLVEIKFGDPFLLGGHSARVLSNGKIVLTAHPYPFGSFNTDYNSARFFPNGQLDLKFGGKGTGLARVRTEAEYLALLSDGEHEAVSPRSARLLEQVPTDRGAAGTYGLFGVQTAVGNQYSSLPTLLSPEATLDHTGASNGTIPEPPAITTERSSLAWRSLADFESPVERSATDTPTEDLDDSILANCELGPALDGPASLKRLASRITTRADADAFDRWWERFGPQVVTFWDSSAG